jgi:hypothetical protein
VCRFHLTGETAMLKLTRVKNGRPIGEPVMLPDELLAKAILEIAGGGYTTKQTVAAMTLLDAFKRDRKVKTTSYILEEVKP